MTDWTDTRKYDDLDYHIEGAITAGQPEENAATHMGLYFAWLVRRDLHNPEFFSDELVTAIKTGELSGSEALPEIDDKLVSDLRAPDGVAFTDWYYGNTYLIDYGNVFADHPEYGVADDAHSNDVMSTVLDRRFAEWVAAGQPKPAPQPEIDLKAFTGTIGLPPRELWDYFRPEARANLEQQLASPPAGTRFFEMRPPPSPHKAPELEALIPAELGEASSVSLSKWHGMPMVKRALKRLGVSPAAAHMAHLSSPLPGRRGALTILLYSVPGVAADQLDEEFRPAFKKPRDFIVSEDDRNVAGRTVHWQHVQEWVSAWWCRDGIVVYASAPDDAALEQLVRRLP
jgi:hypothetical protein